MFSAMSSAVTFVRAEEFSDIRTYGAPDVVRDIMCFGGTPEEAEKGLMVKALGSGFKQSIHMVLQALASRRTGGDPHRARCRGGHGADRVADRDDRAGQVAGQQFHWEAVVDGEVGDADRRHLADGEENLDPAMDVRQAVSATRSR